MKKSTSAKMFNLSKVKIAILTDIIVKNFFLRLPVLRLYSAKPKLTLKLNMLTKPGNLTKKVRCHFADTTHRKPRKEQ